MNRDASEYTEASEQLKRRISHWEWMRRSQPGEAVQLLARDIIRKLHERIEIMNKKCGIICNVNITTGKGKQCLGEAAHRCKAEDGSWLYLCGMHAQRMERIGIQVQKFPPTKKEREDFWMKQGWPKDGWPKKKAAEKPKIEVHIRGFGAMPKETQNALSNMVKRAAKFMEEQSKS